MKMNTPTLPPSKLPEVGTTIFTTMSALASEHGALNVAQGFPDLSPPTNLKEAVKKAIDEGYNQYAPMAGDPGLRVWISEMYNQEHGAFYNADSEITIGAGASSLLFASIQALVFPGDEVIIVDPAYDLYAPAVRLAGGVIARASLPKPPNLGGPGGAIDPEAIRNLISDKTKLVIINAPHNPTGACFTSEGLNELADVLSESNCFLFSDEVYGPMNHDGRPFLSAAGHPGLKNRTLVFGSFGKLLHATGWKIGWVTAPEEITRELRKIHQYDVFSTGAPIQRGLAQYLITDDASKHLRELGPIYEKKRDRLLKGLDGTEFIFSPAEGGYFQILDYSKLDSRGDIEIAREWTVKHGIATIPISPFRQPGSTEAKEEKRLRICFAKGDSTIDEAIKKLRAIDTYYKLL
jgi:methionine aminotransferase